jgi:endonuclease/exonuclease/phosphatase family metal-dependent hydrolase
VEVVKVELPRTRLSLMASDHLPLIAELRVQFT